MARDQELLIKINGTAKNFRAELEKTKQETRDLEDTLKDTARASAIAFAGLATAVGLATNEFRKFEKALVGVGKTTNLNDKQLADFGSTVQTLSTELPVAATELLGIATIAGQLGVEGSENLLLFTETIAKLSVATDLVGEQGSLQIARVLEIVGEGIDTIDTFGSVIVRLGNNFKATESEIVRSTLEVARSTAEFKLSSGEAAALATALRSLGQQAQLGGSVVGRSFRAIQAAIKGTGPGLERLIELTGLTREELTETFQDRAIIVFQKFIEGLGRVSKGTETASEILSDFKLNGDEVNKVLPVLAARSEIFADALNQQSEETANATALNEEARKAFGTLDASLQKVVNTITLLATRFGAEFSPVITGLGEILSSVVLGIANLDKEIITLVSRLVLFVTTAAGVLFGLTSMGIAVISLKKGLAILGGAFLGARISAAAFTGALTFGLSTVVAFLPEIIEFIKSFKKEADAAGITATRSLAEVTAELKRMEEAQVRANEAVEQSASGIFLSQALNRLELIEDNIVALEKEKLAVEAVEAAEKKRLAATATKKAAEETTAKNLAEQARQDAAEALLEKEQVERLRNIRQVAREQEILEDQENKLVKQEIDTVAKQELVDAEIETLAAIREIKQEEVEALKQLDALKTTNEKISLQKNRTNRDKLEIDSNKASIARLAANIKDIKIRESEARSVQFFDESEQDARLAQANIQDKERQDSFNKAFNKLSEEERFRFNQKDLTDLRNSILTKKEVEENAANRKLRREIEERNTRSEDERKNGKDIAAFNAFFRREDVKGVISTGNQLAQLAQSNNSVLKGIGKTAAVAQIAISTAQGAVDAFTSFAKFGPIGAVLGGAAAAAIVAFGVEKTANVLSAQGGGIVPAGLGGARDRIPALLEPGEVVIPRTLAPNFIQSVGAGRRQEVEDVEAAPASVQIEFVGEAASLLRQAQNENDALGVF